MWECECVRTLSCDHAVVIGVNEQMVHDMTQLRTDISLFYCYTCLKMCFSLNNFVGLEYLMSIL